MILTKPADSFLQDSVITQSFRYAIDPTPEQVTVLRSHFGGSRFAYNAMLGLVRANWDENRVRREAGEKVPKNGYLSTSHFGLLYLWAEKRDAMVV